MQHVLKGGDDHYGYTDSWRMQKLVGRNGDFFPVSTILNKYCIRRCPAGGGCINGGNKIKQMEDNIEKIREYAKYSFDEAKKVKQYAHVDIGNGVKSYEFGIGLIILV